MPSPRQALEGALESTRDIKNNDVRKLALIVITVAGAIISKIEEDKSEKDNGIQFF